MENGLNHMQLNGDMLVDLYPHSLYQIKDQPDRPEQPVASFVKFLGGNAAGILILVNDTRHSFLGEDEMNLLIKMLEACKLNTGDVAIVNLAGGQHPIDLVIEEMRPEKIIVFGAGELVTQPMYAIGTLSGSPLLVADDLSDMLPKTEDARVAKQKLWSGLRTLFALN